MTPGSTNLQGGKNSAAPILLAIDTAGSACSVAVGRGAAMLAAESEPLRHGHAEALLPMIDRVMQAAGLPPEILDGIVVAVGPGGFTGIRVGLGAAHGVALALQVPLIGVTSFMAVMAALTDRAMAPGAVLIALDSRRDDLYVQLFDQITGEPLAAPAAVLPKALADYLTGSAGMARLLIAGDVAEMAAAALRGRCHVTIAAGSAPDARGVLAAGLRQIERDPAGSPACPLYLRPPDVTLPKRRDSVPAARR